MTSYDHDRTWAVLGNCGAKYILWSEPVRVLPPPPPDRADSPERRYGLYTTNQVKEHDVVPHWVATTPETQGVLLDKLARVAEERLSAGDENLPEIRLYCARGAFDANASDEVRRSHWEYLLANAKAAGIVIIKSDVQNREEVLARHGQAQ